MIYLTSLTIGGVEWISKLLYEGTEYSAEVGGNIPTATFVLEDSPASVNYLKWSEAFDNAAWTKSNASISANATTDPNGGSTADKLVENSATDYHFAQQGYENIPQDTIVCLSVYAKAAERTRIQLEVTTWAPATISALFDLSGGTVVSTAGGAVNASILSVGSGWYRCSVAGSSGSGATTPALTVVLDNGSGSAAASISYAGDGSSGVYVWGAQVNFGSFAGSYIKTESIGFHLNAIAGRPEVIAYVGAQKVFGGYAAVYEKFAFSPGLLRTRMRCQGYAVLMDRAVTTAEHTFSGTDEAALDTLFSTYCSTISTTPVNQVAADLQDMVVPVGTSIRKAVEMIAERSGASWYVTPTKTLEYFDPATDSPSSPFWLRESSAITVLENTDDPGGEPIPWYPVNATYSSFHLVEDLTASAQHRLSRNTFTVVNGERYYAAVDAKAGTRTWIAIYSNLSDSADYAYFDLTNGALGSVSANVDARIEALGGGKYRCFIGVTAALTSAYVQVNLATGNGVNTYNGDGTSGAYVYAVNIATGHQILHDSLAHTVDAATLANDITVRSGADGLETIDITANGTASDGHVYLEDAYNWPPTGTATPDSSSTSMYLKVGHSGTAYFIQLPLVKFDTSVIPDDATIVSASLILRLLGTAQTATGNGIGVEYYAASNWPISTGDYTSTPSNSAYGYTNPASLPAYSSLELALSSPDSNISKTGETGFRIHYSFTGTPASNIIVAQFGTVESGGNAPVLRVTYTSPAAQSNVTDATSISTYGTQKSTIVDSSVASDAEAALIAAVELAKRKDPLEYGSLETRADGLRIADLVHIESSSHDIDADYLVRSIRVAWPDGILTYSIEYGDWRPDALRLMRQLAALKGVEG